MPRRTTPGSRMLSVLALLLLLTAAGTVAFWVDWFAAGHVAPDLDACYVAFENAFPLADGVMCVFMLLAAWNIVQRRPRAVLWSMVVVGSLWFLGSLDALYNLEHGRYARIAAEPVMLLHALITAHCYLFGLFTFVVVWRYRRLLLVEDAPGWAAHETTPRPRPLTAIATIYPLTAIGIVLFWTRWFMHDRALYMDNPCLVVFEDTFPLADGIVALVAAASSYGILTRRPWALATTLTASGGLLFLASMDGLYYVEQQRWADADGAFMAGLILTLYALGIGSAVATWRHRAWLLAIDAAAQPVSAGAAPVPSP